VEPLIRGEAVVVSRRTIERQGCVPDRQTARVRWVAFILFAASLALRLVYLNDGLFHFDAVKMVNGVEKTVETGEFHSWFRSGSEIINLILYLPLNALFDVEKADFTARLTNAIFGSLAVAVLFLLTHLLSGRIFAGLSAAVLYSVSPIFLAVSTIAKVHGVEAFFILTAIYLVFRFHETKSRIALSLSAACMGFTPWVRESGLVFLPIYALAYLKPELRLDRRPVRFPAYALAPANLAAALVPLAAVLGAGMYIDIVERIQHQVMSALATNNASFIGLFSHVLTKALHDAWINFGLPVAGLSIAGLALLLLRERNRFLAAFLLGWLATVFYFGNLHSYGARYLTVVSIPVYILSGLTLSMLADHRHRMARPGAFSLLALAAILSFLSAYPRIEYRSRISGPKDYALWLKEQTPPNAVIIAMDDSVFIEYYAGLRCKHHPIGDPQAMKVWVREVRELLANGTPVYAVGDGLTYDHRQLFRRTLLNNFRLEQIGSHLTENYHRAELRFTFYDSPLIQLSDLFDTREEQRK
jgi:predicted membrane-bound mannosyltransferase